MDMRAFCLATTVMSLGCLTSTASLAHDDDARLCNTLIDSSGDAVIEADGDAVAHAGTTECPEAEAVAVLSEVVAVAPEPELRLVEQTVYFPFDVAELTPDAEAAIEALADELAGSEAQRVAVQGHADRAGPADYNLELSEERAANVEAALIEQGIPAGAIAREAFGESRPALETGDGVALPANRRANIEVEY